LTDITLNKSIRDSWIWKDPEILKAYLDFTIGPEVRSVTQLAREWNWSRHRVYRFLEKIADSTPSVTVSVTTKSTNKETSPDKRTLSGTPNGTLSVASPSKSVSSQSASSTTNTTTTLPTSYRPLSSLSSTTKKKKEEKPVIRITEKEERKSYTDRPKDLAMVIEYFIEKKVPNPKQNAELFYDHYESVGWIRGKTKIKRWRSCLTQWKDTFSNGGRSRGFRGSYLGGPESGYQERTYTYQCLEHPKYKTTSETNRLFKRCPECYVPLKRVDSE
jgi:hypothetical protein